MIVIFAGLAYAAGLSMRGRRVILSQVSVVQASPQGGMVQVDGLVGVYSPYRAAYDIRLPDRTLARSSVSHYLGSSIAGPVRRLRLDQGPPTRIRALEVDVGTMSDFVIQGLLPWQTIASQVSLTRATPAATGSPTVYRVQGQLSNRTGEQIDHPALVFGSTVTPLASSLQPGATESFDFQIQVGNPQELHVLLDALAGTASPQGPGRREIARRHSILEGFIGAQLYNSSSSQIPFSGLTLIGWMGTSPLEAQVDGARSQTEATTLIIAPLTVDTGKDGQVLLPRGFSSWQRIAGDREATPRQIYAYQSPPTFRFMLDSPQLPDLRADTKLEKLIVHVYTPTPSLHPPPMVSIKRAGGDEWEALPGLDWGANVIPDPERFVDSLGVLGALDISVETQSISDQPVSIDIEVIGRER
jgi:hypothetical protein